MQSFEIEVPPGNLFQTDFSYFNITLLMAFILFSNSVTLYGLRKLCVKFHSQLQPQPGHDQLEGKHRVLHFSSSLRASTKHMHFLASGTVNELQTV